MSRRARGFTLIEVLLATVLLAAGLALAFATLTAASRTAAAGEAMAERAERVRAVEGFIRRRLTAARPLAWESDPAGPVPTVRFRGGPERMRFVADLPNYLGQGGPYLHDLRVVPEERGEGVRLLLGLDLVLAGSTVADPAARPPEVLADGLRTVRFRYRAAAEDGMDPEQWRDEWEPEDRLPVMVEATFTDLDGRQWPPLLVALPQALAVPGRF